MKGKHSLEQDGVHLTRGREKPRTLRKAFVCSGKVLAGDDDDVTGNRRADSRSSKQVTHGAKGEGKVTVSRIRAGNSGKHEAGKPLRQIADN